MVWEQDSEEEMVGSNCGYEFHFEVLKEWHKNHQK